MEIAKALTARDKVLDASGKRRGEESKTSSNEGLFCPSSTSFRAFSLGSSFLAFEQFPSVFHDLSNILSGDRSWKPSAHYQHLPFRRQDGANPRALSKHTLE